MAASKFAKLEEAQYSLKELMEADLPEPEWIIDGWLVDEPTIIAGRPKTFKSTFAMEMAISVASDTPFLDDDRYVSGRKRPVVYVMEENSAGSTRHLIQDIVERKGLGLVQKDAAGVFHYAGDDFPLYIVARAGFKLDDDWVGELLDFCEYVEAEVVVLDAWYRVLPHGVEAKSGTDLAPVFDRIQEFHKKGITPVVVAHTNKSGGSIKTDKGGLSIMDSTYIEAFFEGFIMNYPADSGRLSAVDVRRFFRNKPAVPDVTVMLDDMADRKGGWSVGDFEAGAAHNAKLDDREKFEKTYPLYKMAVEGGKRTWGEIALELGVAESTISRWKKSIESGNKSTA